VPCKSVCRSRILHDSLKLPEARSIRPSAFYRTIKLAPTTMMEVMRNAWKNVLKARRRMGSRTGQVCNCPYGSGSFKADGDGMASMSTSEGETLVTLEIHIFGATDWKLRSDCASEDKKIMLYPCRLRRKEKRPLRIEFAVLKASRLAVEGYSVSRVTGHVNRSIGTLLGNRVNQACGLLRVPVTR